MTPLTGPWLSEDEVIFHRMNSFHCQRVDALAAGRSPLDKPEGGVLILHLIPRSCVQGRGRFDGAKLKEHGGTIPVLGEGIGCTRFNVDGFLQYAGKERVRAYSQLFRDGRLEAAMTGVALTVDRPPNRVLLRDTDCEMAVQQAVGEYLRFCKAMSLLPPVHLFSALVACSGVRVWTDRRFFDVSDHAIDRSPLMLPDIEIDSLDADPTKLLRIWGDSLWQACGMLRSFNYDEAGNWRPRR